MPSAGRAAGTAAAGLGPVRGRRRAACGSRTESLEEAGGTGADAGTLARPVAVQRRLGATA